MSLILRLLTLAFLCLAPTNSAWAEQAAAAGSGPELRLLAATGGGVLPFRVGLFTAVRGRLLPHTPFGLEVSLYLPYGAGASLLLDVYRSETLRVHVLDLGIFYAWSPRLRVSRPDIKRDVDLTGGAGVEWNINKRWAVTLDWRLFAPNPLTVPFYYGDFSRPIYRDAAIGGQLWFGLAYTH